MFAKDVPPTRLAAAQEAVRRFLEKLPDRYRVGVVTFSSEAQVVAPMTLDRQVVEEAVDFLYPGRARPSATRSRGRSSSPRARARRARLSRSRLDEPADDDPDQPVTAILLLSDGAQTAGILQPFEGAAQAIDGEDPRLHGRPGHAGRDGDLRPLRISRTIPVPPGSGDPRADRGRHRRRVLCGCLRRAPQQVYERLGSQIGRYKQREATDILAGSAAVLLLAAGLLAGLWFPVIP